MSKPKETYAIYLALVAFGVLFLLRCNFGSGSTIATLQPIATAYHGLEYAGSQTCISCHEDIYNQHIKTPHHNTSQLVNDKNVLGDFTINNSLKLNDSIVYKMTAEDSLYQSGFVNGQLINKAPFDIIVGSGTKGQTYLYWDKSQLYQLPVSSLTDGNRWINSPGYTNDRIHFNRAVVPNCLECHSTFAKNSLPTDFNSNRYVKNEMILGVDCESCHGPSLQHVNAHNAKPELKDAQHILDITTLSRQQQLDACAKCHSGLQRPLKMPFTFKTGDKLNSFKIPNHAPIDSTKIDVHGNQYGLLTASACFKKSDVLNCSTCHNPHKNERGNAKAFSLKCISCHQDTSTHSVALTDKMTSNCIDCHMPLFNSSAISFKGPDINDIITLDSVKVRTHKIGIYPDISERIYEFLNKQ